MNTDRTTRSRSSARSTTITFIPHWPGEKRKKERNDRIGAVEKDAHSFADKKTTDDLGKRFCRELETFFINYHRLSAEKYCIIRSSVPARPPVAVVAKTALF